MCPGPARRIRPSRGRSAPPADRAGLSPGDALVRPGMAAGAPLGMGLAPPAARRYAPPPPLTRPGDQRGQPHYGRHRQDAVRAAAGGVAPGARPEARHPHPRIRPAVARCQPGGCGRRGRAAAAIGRRGADFPSLGTGALGHRRRPFSLRHAPARKVRRRSAGARRRVSTPPAGARRRHRAGGCARSLRRRRRISAGQFARAGGRVGPRQRHSNHALRRIRPRRTDRARSASLEPASAGLSILG